MAIWWASLLKTVPWANVISTAPVVADGAKKLWNAVARKTPPSERGATDPSGTQSTDAGAIARIQAQLASIETSASELHNQMVASSELIKAMADQNAELIKRVEANRVRLLWLSGAVAIAGTVAIVCLALVIAVR